MFDISQYLGSQFHNKRYKLTDWMCKQDPTFCFIQEILLSRAVVAHAFNPSTWVSEFQESQGYTEKPCLEKKKKKPKPTKQKETFLNEKDSYCLRKNGWKNVFQITRRNCNPNVQ